MSGWYRLHRGWQEHAVFRSEAFCRRAAFVWLIEHASFEAGEVRLPAGVVTLKRGQLAHSLRFIAEAWKWPEAKVRRFLTSLREAKIIDASVDAGRTIVTICNYDKYQSRERITDAPADAQVTHDRRVGDAKSKEGEEREEGKGRARARGGYAFEGRTVRLTQVDFDAWRATFHAIPDLRAELSSIDSWYGRQPADERDGWFHRTKRMLNAKHQASLARRDAPTSAGGGTSIDDSFLRRLARFEAAQAGTCDPASAGV